MTPMPFDDLEQSYDALAQGIDRAGRDNEAVFLAKLALLLANEIGQFERFKTCVDAALADLPDPDHPETDQNRRPM